MSDTVLPQRVPRTVLPAVPRTNRRPDIVLVAVPRPGDPLAQLLNSALCRMSESWHTGTHHRLAP